MNDRTACGRARTLLDLGRPNEARDVLASVVAQDPHDAEALGLLARACLEMDDLSAALSSAEAAVQAEPDNDWAYRLLALALARLDRYNSARRAADAALRLAPDNWRSHVVRAEVDVACRCAGPETVAAARTAVRLAPTEAGAHRVLSTSLIATGQLREAEAAAREALRLDPSDAAAHNELARVHLRRRRHLGRAAFGFASAAALDPQDDVAIRNLVAVGARTLRVVHTIVLVAWWVAANRDLPNARDHQRLIASIAAATAAGALIAFAVVFWRGARPRTVRLLRVVFRRDRLLAAWLGCLVVAFVMLAAAPLAPRSGVAGVRAIAFVAIASGFATSLVRRRRINRARTPAR